jgi:hypothetical protein
MSYEDRASVPGQGLDYGVARLLRGEGAYLRDASEAALNLTEVQRRGVENWKKTLETRYEMQQLHHQVLAAERGKPLTEADFHRMSQLGKPRRLTPSELETVTGQIDWPLVLQSEMFATYRDWLDQLFADRAYHGTFGLEQYLQAERSTHDMQELLRFHITDFEPMDYMKARRFLESLSFEAKFPTTATEPVSTVGQRDVGSGGAIRR